MNKISQKKPKDRSVVNKKTNARSKKASVEVMSDEPKEIVLKSHNIDTNIEKVNEDIVPQPSMMEIILMKLVEWQERQWEIMEKILEKLDWPKELTQEDIKKNLNVPFKNVYTFRVCKWYIDREHWTISYDAPTWPIFKSKDEAVKYWHQTFGNMFNVISEIKPSVISQ